MIGMRMLNIGMLMRMLMPFMVGGNSRRAILWSCHMRAPYYSTAACTRA
jgi:hypothetical protein